MVNIKSGKGGSFWFFSTQLLVSYLQQEVNKVFAQCVSIFFATGRCITKKLSYHLGLTQEINDRPTVCNYTANGNDEKKFKDHSCNTIPSASVTTSRIIFQFFSDSEVMQVYDADVVMYSVQVKLVNLTWKFYWKSKLTLT